VDGRERERFGDESGRALSSHQQCVRGGAGVVSDSRLGEPIADCDRACRVGVFVPILNKLGFDRLELVICAGAPLPPETMALWQMLGVNVVEMYGQTETAGGIISGQRGPFPRPGDVGTVPAGWEVKLAKTNGGLNEGLDGAHGEVLVRSPDLFECYWNNADATGALKGADGFLRTGDIGEWRDGALRLIDRARDFIVTSGGKTISPSFIENVLRTSPFVSEVVVFGHGRKYLTALIEIDADRVSDWHATTTCPIPALPASRLVAMGGTDRSRNRASERRNWRGPSRSRISASCPRRSIPRRTASR
jgi:long-subunit acyl-CoA synthetase (AMP-forming)